MKTRDIFPIGAAGVIGYFCMTHSAALPVTALIIPILWILACSRVSAFFVILAYHLAISRGLVIGAPVFLSETHTLADAIVLWVAMSVGVSLPFLLFWSPQKYKKALCLFGALLLAYFLPPLALIGVVNPMMMSGCLFPGWAWFALATVCVIYFLCVIDRRIAWLCVGIILILPILEIGALNPPKTPTGFFALNTSFGQLGSGSFNFESDYERIQMVFRDARKANLRELEEKYIVFPETIAGRLNRPGLELWESELKRLIRADQKVIFGGEISTDNGRKYDNAMILYDTQKMTTIAQRIPVPYSMYRGPFAATGANLHLWNDGILELPYDVKNSKNMKKAAVIICYEAFLSLPYILSFMQNPDLILWAGNQWWCKDTSLPLIQERCVALWAQMFDVPALIVRNR